MTQQKSALVLIVSVLLFVLHSTRLYASTATIPDTMAECESMLGKLTPAVLTKFGPPDTAEIVPKDQHTTGPGSSIINNEPELLIWTYKKITPTSTLKFVFLNKLLIAVTWKPFVWSPAMADHLGADTETLIKAYKRASLKLGYSGGDNPVELRETTQNGHLARFFCRADVATFIKSHVFNPNTGIYTDTIIPNPGFSLSVKSLSNLDAMILTNGQGKIYELDAGQPKGRMSPTEYLIRMSDSRLRRAVFCDVLDAGGRPYSYVPVTSSNIPWLQGVVSE